MLCNPACEHFVSHTWCKSSQEALQQASKRKALRRWISDHFWMILAQFGFLNKVIIWNSFYDNSRWLSPFFFWCNLISQGGLESRPQLILPPILSFYVLRAQPSHHSSEWQLAKQFIQRPHTGVKYDSAWIALFILWDPTVLYKLSSSESSWIAPLH